MKYIFKGKYTDKEKSLFEKAQEEDLIKISKYLETNSPRLKEIAFEVFDTKEDKQVTDPLQSISRASARYKEFTIYRIWDPDDDPHFPHEITHLIAHTWAKPYQWETELDTAYGETIKKDIEMLSTSFMQEGLAIAVDELVFKRKLFEHGERKFPDDWCRHNNKDFPKLKEVINFEGFCSYDNDIVVPYSASLSKYFLNTYGLSKYKSMYVSLKETFSPEKNINLIEKVYDLSENTITNEWKGSIGL